jgi:hypothetical protein
MVSGDLIVSQLKVPLISLVKFYSDRFDPNNVGFHLSVFDPKETSTVIGGYITLNIKAFDESLVFYTHYQSGHTFDVEFEIRIYQEYMYTIVEYLNIPFDRIPLCFPLQASTYKNFIGVILKARLRSGI